VKWILFLSKKSQKGGEALDGAGGLLKNKIKRNKGDNSIIPSTCWYALFRLLIGYFSVGVMSIIGY
jgi:hypothetical protein